MENHCDFILDELLKQGPWGGGSRWFWLSLATTEDKKSGTHKIIWWERCQDFPLYVLFRDAAQE